MKKYFKLFICVCVFFAVLPSLFGIEVDEEEIRRTSSMEIQFINYEGPHQLVNTVDEIKGIGYGLVPAAENGSAGNRNSYYIVHAVDSQVNTGFDADILFIGKGAGVDHVRNLRVIIASYLEKAYGYSYRDSYTLATFVTIYNAVYRGNLDYFNENYKQVVTKNLTSSNAGLSVRWDEWAGNSAIVIPLSGTGISTVDTTAISDEKVIDSMKETEDERGVDSRKDLVDLKEKEVEAAREQAQEARKEAEDNRKQAEEIKEDTVSVQVELENDKKEVQELEKKEEKTPEDQQQIEEKKQEIQKKEEQIAEKEKQIEELQQAAEQKEAEAQAAETFAIKKEEEARRDRDSISQDQTEMLNEEDQKAMSGLENTVAGLRITDQANLLSEIALVDTSSGAVKKTSALKQIRNRTLINTGSVYIAVAGESSSGAIRLVQIDPVTLDIIKQGTDDISPLSVLVTNGTDIYAVVKSDSGFVLGRFDESLVLQAKSDVQVAEYTPVIIDRSTVVVQSPAGEMLLLHTSTLK